MTKQKIVLFDIDYTLFDTGLLRDKMYKAILGISMLDKQDKQAVADMYADIVKEHGYFKPSEFIQEVHRRLGGKINIENLRKAIWDKKNFDGNLYSETVSIIEEVSKKAKVGIFSKGFSKRWQKTKLIPLMHLLAREHIHITVDKYKTIPSLLEKYADTKLYIVDDALDVLYAAKELNKDIFVVWVKRGIYAQKQKPIEGFKPDAIIGDLQKVVSIVSSADEGGAK